MRVWVCVEVVVVVVVEEEEEEEEMKGRTERDTNAFTEKGDQEYV